LTSTDPAEEVVSVRDSARDETGRFSGALHDRFKISI
jgi:hypothetical protein